MNILLFIPAAVWLLISAGFFTLGEYFSKLWGTKPTVSFSFLVVLFYMLSSFTWLPALLHRNQIAIMGVIWLLLATIGTVSVGVFAFHESITTIEWVGIAFALVALAFLGFYNP